MSYEQFCIARALVEKHLREGLLTKEELFERCQWDHSLYDEDWTIDTIEKNFCVGDDYMEEGLEDEIGIVKAWFCRGCPLAFFGENCLSQRRRHQKKCRYRIKQFEKTQKIYQAL